MENLSFKNEFWCIVGVVIQETRYSTRSRSSEKNSKAKVVSS